MDEKKLETIRKLEMALGAALAAVQPNVRLSWKSMLGGAGYFVDDVMFAGWYGNGLALKLPQDQRAALLAVDGAVQVSSSQYVEVPPSFLDDTTLLEPWVARSVSYVKAPKGKGKRSSGALK